MDVAIEAHGLTKRFGSTVAVDDLSFTVRAGRVTGFVGPNGAGKSTTMRMILGLDAPNWGEVLVHGRRYGALECPLREVGALVDAPASHPGRRAQDHLRWLAASNGIPRHRVDEVLGLVGLGDVARRRTGGFSLGMAQRLGIAAALLGDPPVLILDEPVNGLDPDGIRWIRDLLRSLAEEGRAVFVSSHLMSELEGTADDLIVIGRGRLIADTSVGELIETMSDNRVDVRSPQAGEVMRVLVGEGATVTATGSDALVVTGLDVARIADLDGGARPPAPRADPSPGLARGGIHGANGRRRRVRRGSRGAELVSVGQHAEPVPTRVGAPRALRAEWIKLRSVRSTTWAILALVGVSVLFTAIATSESETSGGSPGNPGDNDIVLDSLQGVWFGQIAIAVLAVLAITSEYSTRLIRMTFAANPRRRAVLVAKTAVVAAIALVAGLATSVACFFVGQEILQGNGFTYENGYPAASLADGPTFRAVAGSARLRRTPRRLLAGGGRRAAFNRRCDHRRARSRPRPRDRDRLPSRAPRRAR